MPERESRAKTAGSGKTKPKKSKANKTSSKKSAPKKGKRTATKKRSKKKATKSSKSKAAKSSKKKKISKRAQKIRDKAKKEANKTALEIAREAVTQAQAGPGRPTKYHPEFAELLIAKRAEGFTIEAFAGIIGVSRRVIFDWIDAHEDFKAASEIATCKCRLFLESVGLQGMTGQLKRLIKKTATTEVWEPAKFNSNAWRMYMQNLFGWKDKQEVENTGSYQGGVLVVEPQMDEDEWEALQKFRTEKAKAKELSGQACQAPKQPS